MPRRHGLLCEALVCTALAATAAGLLAWLAPPGGDLAAHLYQRALFLRHGFTLWDNYWYAGRYAFAGYSVLYYPLAAALGIRLLAVLTVAVSAGAFALLLGREWGADARWANVAFALLWAGVLITGEFPFALGVALLLLALLAFQAGRRWTGGVLTLLVLAASPVALVFLVVVLTGVAFVRGWQVVPALALTLAVAIELALLAIFPSHGRFPFPTVQAGAALGFCALGLACTWRVERARLLRAFLATYALALAIVWLEPAALGENMARLRYLAVPLALLILALCRWRPLPLAVLLAGSALAWNVVPLGSGWVRAADDVTKSAAVWRGPIAFLHTHLTLGYRVEAVDTAEHWPAYYLAGAGIPLARGWFRQDDFPTNALLYRRFTAAAYLRWLRSLGVSYVVLTDALPDYSARREARIVPTALNRVSGSKHVAIYAVPEPRSIVSGPGLPRVVAFRQASLAVRVTRAGTYRIAVHWSPYWHASAGRLSQTPDGMTELRTTAPGRVSLTFAP